jgi:hypothetical protein
VRGLFAEFQIRKKKKKKKGSKIGHIYTKRKRERERDKESFCKECVLSENQWVRAKSRHR